MEVTEQAKNHLKNSLSSVKASPKSTACFRVVKDGEAFRIELGSPSDTDKTFSAGGETVLAVEPEIDSQCEGMTLDVDTSKDPAKLVLLPTVPGD